MLSNFVKSNPRPLNLIQPFKVTALPNTNCASKGSKIGLNDIRLLQKLGESRI